MNPAQRVINRNRQKLRNHYSGNPEFELSFEQVDELQNQIEDAEAYLADEPLDFDKYYWDDLK